jgi:lipoate-protein ligase A
VHWALAIEEAITETVAQQRAPNTIRYWRTPNAIVIGRFQCLKSEVVASWCSEYGTEVARRFTGGGATYHDTGNLNFALSMRKDSKRIASLPDLFQRVGLAVVKGLSHLELSATFDRMGVYVSDRKLSGLAGLVSTEAVFVHGSLLVDSNLKILRRVLNLDSKKPVGKFVPSVVRTVTTLSKELGRKIRIQEAEEALQRAFREELGAVFKPGELMLEELELAETLLRKKYSTRKWAFITCEACSEVCLEQHCPHYEDVTSSCQSSQKTEPSLALSTS